MIFASVGSVLPFDRLARAVDDWAGKNPETNVILQIGRSDYIPQHATWVETMDQSRYRDMLSNCTLFVAHVGIGSIIQALECKKQMLLMPRQASQREHTTDHQLHTAAKFRDYEGIRIVNEADELNIAMSEMLAAPLKVNHGLSTTAPVVMLKSVKGFLMAK